MSQVPKKQRNNKKTLVLKTNYNTKKNQNNFYLKSNQIIISGKHATLSALQNPRRELFHLITTHDHFTVWNTQIKNLGLTTEVKIMKREEIDKINNYKPHQNVMLIAEPLKRLSLDEFLMEEEYISKQPLRLIILDQVTDPQNVGTIIRSAYAFKFNALALSQTNSPIESASMSKASSGAIEKLKIIELSNMSRAIKTLQDTNFRVYGLAHGGMGNIFDLEKEIGNVAIIVGSEGNGLRRLTREKVDQLLEIPINPDSDSLNVSSAASISMFQLQKNFIKN